ncbi:hypothetical protein GDO81_013419 [Engystomops pustulosus]|uniref:C2H2-type domain-containing protein n=1 Tax=Engystomops pustulosus TaxID=76066 RepID=A0AAV7B0D0_ENGPU|nr:hypothetical protein GDO81_013419 [Engystomops pustulosus]
MDSSNVSVLSSSLAYPSGLSNPLPGINEHQSTLVNKGKSSQTVVLNGISLPVVQIAQQEGQQTPLQLAPGGTSFAIENTNLSVIFTPQPQNILQKPQTQTLTLNIVNTLPVLGPNTPASLIGPSPGKSKSIGKHICAHCGRDCLKPSVLEKHIRSHTGERPFPCNICGISFKTQSNLYKHRRTQTHVNNAKQCFDSDCGNCTEDKLHVHSDQSTCLEISSGTKHVCMDKNNSAQNKHFSGIQETDRLPENKEDISVLSLMKVHDKASTDSYYLSQTIVSTGMPNIQKTVMDPKSTASSRHGQLQRQHETCVDKQWDSSHSERKLKKCESTDSGYLSHSDSADLQMFAGSPLHSLSECSIESGNILGISSVEGEDKTIYAQKKNLEERISMLISQNKAVVDNTHLDNVRPRKTALSKQGSIDLPMPYTFKGSFHFDIKSLDANRKNVSILPAKSNFTQSEKNKPLFFHSVPTQISTTIENIILPRSNSLPFVEGGRLKDRLTVHNIKGSGKQSVNANYNNILLSNSATACTVDFSSSHPRGLVRQAAVDEMQIGNGSDSTTTEDIKERKKITGDRLSSKISSKKGGQRKSNMFSHEKWQMYGDETFKKFYQKIKKNEQLKKIKQDYSESKGTLSSENCELRKSSENTASMPVVTLPHSSMYVTGTYTVTNDALSINDCQITLSGESSAQGNNPDSKLKCDLKMSKVDMNNSHNVAANVQTHTDDSNNPSILVTENPKKGPSISGMHEFIEFGYVDNFQNHEGSPSDRKKLKVARLKGELFHSVSFDIPDDAAEYQNKNVNCITDGKKTCHSFSTNLNKDVLLSHEGDSGDIPAQLANSFIPTPQTLSTPKKSLFSPRYLIKFNFTGTSVKDSVLESNQPTVLRDTGLINVTEDNSKCIFVPTKLYQPAFLNNQLKRTQKHDSVIAPFGKISLNEECVPESSNSTLISQLPEQNRDSDIQGTQKFSLDNTCLDRQHACEDPIVVKDLISEKMELNSSMVLVSSEIIATNKFNKPSQDTLLVDILLPGQTSWKSLDKSGFKSQESSFIAAQCTNSPPCISSVKVTQVTFSTMNTEPKSTWCWLDRCLPLPAEQKEKSFSVYASLSSNAFKERCDPHQGRIEKDVDWNTIDGQPIISSAQKKECLGEETDNSKNNPLIKKSSKMGTVVKYRHVKRSKDGTRGRSHSRVSQHRTTGTHGQDQQHKKINCDSTLESGGILMRTTNFDLNEREGRSTSIHLSACEPAVLSQESEAKLSLDSKLNENTISTTTEALEQLVTGKDSQSSLLTEEMAQQEPLEPAEPLTVQQCQQLSGFPPQKHVRKILQRSKTIGHSLGDNAVQSSSWVTSFDSHPRVPVETKDGIRRSSLQNMHAPDFYMDPNSSNSGLNMTDRTFSINWKLESDEQEEPSLLQNQSLKKLKKINLEVMRKQTHVECSDSSSDDEDRLYIEIIE